MTSVSQVQLISLLMSNIDIPFPGKIALDTILDQEPHPQLAAEYPKALIFFSRLPLKSRWGEGRYLHLIKERFESNDPPSPPIPVSKWTEDDLTAWDDFIAVVKLQSPSITPSCTGYTDDREKQINCSKVVEVVRQNFESIFAGHLDELRFIGSIPPADLLTAEIDPSKPYLYYTDQTTDHPTLITDLGGSEVTRFNLGTYLDGENREYVVYRLPIDRLA